MALQQSGVLTLSVNVTGTEESQTDRQTDRQTDGCGVMRKWSPKAGLLIIIPK